MIPDSCPGTPQRRGDSGQKQQTMKTRNEGFLANDKIPHESEIFDYIVELHELLWRFVRVHKPGAMGKLSDIVDEAVYIAEKRAEVEITKQDIVTIERMHDALLDDFHVPQWVQYLLDARKLTARMYEAIKAAEEKSL